MTTHTFFVNHLPQSGSVIELASEEKHHLFKVFRAVPGDRVRLLDGKGLLAEAEILPDKRLRIDSCEAAPEDACELHLVFALPRKNQLDLLLKQAAELGVKHLHPVDCKYSVSKGENLGRWQLQLQEACKQSHNPFLPQLHEPVRLAEKLQELKAQNVQLVYGAIRSDSGKIAPNTPTAWIVGPEGGFSPEEEELFKTLQVTALNLGPHILRLETAASCGIAVLRQLLQYTVMLLLICFFAACSAEPEKDPLYIKALNLRQAGEAQKAYYFFRKAALKHPENPKIALALAELCDEELDLPEEALFRYSEYAKLLPDDAPEKAGAAKFLEHARKKLVPENASAPELVRLQQENATLQRQIDALKNYIREFDRKHRK